MSYTLHGSNFTQPLPEIILNGDITILGTVQNTTPNLDPANGNLDDYFGTAIGTIPGESDTKYTDIRKLGQFMYQYVKIPGEVCAVSGVDVALPAVTSPCTVKFTVPAGCVIHYTFNEAYPSPTIDNINCFRYGILPQYSKGQLLRFIDSTIAGVPLVNDKGQDGTYIYAVAYKFNSATQEVEPNDQSPLLIAKFHIDSTY